MDLASKKISIVVKASDYSTLYRDVYMGLSLKEESSLSLAALKISN